MNTVKENLTHPIIQAKLNAFKKAYEVELNKLNTELANALYFDGYDLSVSECALVLNLSEKVVRNYLNPKLNKLTPVYVNGKTFVLYQSIEFYKKTTLANKSYKY